MASRIGLFGVTRQKSVLKTKLLQNTVKYMGTVSYPIIITMFVIIITC